MLIGVLSDVHANAAALAAVLKEARKAGVEQLALLGDVVGYYYEPAAVIEQLSEWNCAAIQGNHDRMILAARTDDAAAALYRSKYGTAVDAALEQLGPSSWNWLGALPVQQRLDLSQHNILLCHGSPFDQDAYVYPDAEPSLIDQVRAVSDSPYDAIWMGHTHWPFCSAGRPWLLNPGSVGQPRDIGGLASWCLFNSETGTLAWKRTEFPTGALIAAVLRNDPGHTRNHAVLQRNRLTTNGAPA
jgi:putative phosphoesterase